MTTMPQGVPDPQRTASIDSNGDLRS
jgi:hypothetical protein